MRIKKLHGWQLSPAEAINLQREMAARVSTEGWPENPRYIAGTDLAVGRAGEMATAAVVVLSYPELKVAEVKLAQGRLEWPYVPGLLSFREAPLVLAAAESLGITPDLFIVDGQGIAHPRRIGLASHLGLFWDIPTIGCAKSLLNGHCEEPGAARRSWTELRDKDEVIGAAVRTREKVRPVYVSPGHKISLEAAIHWVLACSRGYRLPEPTRLAHLAAGGHLNAETTSA